ncbi:PepSY domain-containing protein [Loktanella sp. DJP18]|uniref:PepSY domain-containing protein n=1 Tax=Loktanella sp. DJP18 TaxID=3409788 RepID=UPI003BB7058E
MKYLLIVLLLLAPAAAQAQSVQDQIMTQLTAQGFTRIEVSRTLLGRVKIEARSPTLERELVFNPSTGEILRDYWQDRDDDDGSRPRVRISQANDDRDGADDNSGRGSFSSGGGDDRADDGDDRDDDSDDRDDDGDDRDDDTDDNSGRDSDDGGDDD